MKTNNLYKYINLLIRIVIGLTAVWYIYSKLKGSINLNENEITFNRNGFVFIGLALLLLFLNWGIEALKWKYAIRKVKEITFLKAFRYTITGITLGLITPNRIGEIPARAILLSKKYFKEIALKTSVSSFSQVLITFLIGGFCLVITQRQLPINLNSTIFISIIGIISVLFLLFYFKINKLESLVNKISYFREKEVVKALSEFKKKELMKILLYSLIRYIVFSVQFWLLLFAFEIKLIKLEDVFLIPVCFLFASIIPTILISEIGVRGSVALFVFGLVSDLDFQIVLASVLLWVINVSIPALIGLFNLNDFRVFQEE